VIRRFIMEIKKAVKTRQSLRLAIDGVSGSGKTYTALSVASGMGGPIIAIDSEHGSASLYADRFAFDTIELNLFQIENYIEALEMAASGNDGKPYPVVIIDSTSHAWDALVERVERIASQKYGGNTFRAWGEGTPLQKKLIEAMLNYPGHVIVTCRSKTEYSVDKDNAGKTTIKKVGTAAVQRQGFEYEFTMAMTMDANHVGLITKDRTSKFQDQFIPKPGKEFGKDLIAWLNEGAAPPPPAPPPPKSVAQQCHDEMVQLGNIINSVSDTGERYFTIDEYNTVKAEVASILKSPLESRIAPIGKLLDEYKALLVERVAFFDNAGAGENPGEVPGEAAPPDPAETAVKPGPVSAQPTTEAPPPGPAEAEEAAPPREQEPVEGAPEAAADDGFTDDIPWNDLPSKKPQNKTSRRSLSKEFADRIKNKQQEPASVAGGSELDIF
jgi:hypothetical protein